MKKIIFKYAELVLTIISAMMIWWLAYRLFSAPHLNNWSWITFFIAIFFIFWSLGALVIRDEKVFFGATALALLSQLFFVRSRGIIFIIFISFLFLVISRRAVDVEIKSRLKLSIWQSLRIGRRFFVLAIALMLAGQYYFFDNPQIETDNLPKINMQSAGNPIVFKIVALADKDLLNGKNNFTSVDEYIIKKTEEKRSEIEIGGNYSSSNFEEAKMREYPILLERRNDISKMLERDVAGEEAMIDVFWEIINKKLSDFLNVNYGYVSQNFPVMKLVFSAIIFLAVSGIGMLVSAFLVFVVAMIFRILMMMKLLSIEEKAVNMEVVKVN